jgi:hypothetical protein
VDHTILTAIVTPVAAAFGVVAGAFFKPLFEWLSARLKSDETLTLKAREALLKETEEFRAELREEIDTLRREVQTLRDENLTLRRERLESEERHRQEIVRLNADWERRYGELAARHDVAMQRLEGLSK